MLAYLLRRLIGLVAVLLAMAFLIFALQGIIPADPARAIAGVAAPVEVLEAVRDKLGLSDPVPVQYGRFLGRVVQGDLGTSIRTRQPVLADIQKYLPASLELGLAALLIGTALAGLFALVHRRFPGSAVVRLTLITAGSTPIFLTALLLVYFVWFRLGWLPGAGRLSHRGFSGPTGLNLIDGLLAVRPDIALDALQHLLLPALAVALPIAVAVGRSLGASLHEVMRRPYIRTMRGKGLSEGEALWRHGLRNAASAPLAMLGLQIGLMFGNLMVVERIFAWPGLGLYMVQSFASADLPAILGVSLAFGSIYIVANIGIEMAQSLADPRIGLSRSRAGAAD
ncbi:peptide ABC transporter permease [Devosia insulae DS-56]|uniref:Peptide ABC transporter permease n=1 Tax=Devosia insulae DS-56 TaxID=1116389 RepID=A0A1E5XIV2_9HYPH|nr:ABC transporter permease [Devosia insulae]OEO28515.1 peptide ABC transporter permease [Devosia insulae DS-56]